MRCRGSAGRRRAWQKCAALSMRRSCWPTSPPGAALAADHRPVNVKGVKSTDDQIGGNLDVRVDRISQPGVISTGCSSMPKGTEKQHELRLHRASRFPASWRWQAASIVRPNAEGSLLSDTRFQTPVGLVALTRSIARTIATWRQKISIGPHC